MSHGQNIKHEPPRCNLTPRGKRKPHLCSFKEVVILNGKKQCHNNRDTELNLLSMVCYITQKLVSMSERCQNSERRPGSFETRKSESTQVIKKKQPQVKILTQPLRRRRGQRVDPKSFSFECGEFIFPPQRGCFTSSIPREKKHYEMLM